MIKKIEGYGNMRRKGSHHKSRVEQGTGEKDEQMTQTFSSHSAYC